jgi:hypothetical protein
MGRFADLCAEIASEADEGLEGLVLPTETLARLRDAGWADEDLSDALEFVHMSFVLDELTAAADSLSARLIEVLGSFSDDEPFRRAVAGRAHLSIEVIGQLVRRVVHLEEVVAPLREGSPVERSAFDRLEKRLADQGLDAPTVPRAATRRRHGH